MRNKKKVIKGEKMERKSKKEERRESWSQRQKTREKVRISKKQERQS